MALRVDYEYPSDIQPSLEVIRVPGPLGSSKKVKTCSWEPVVINITEDVDIDLATSIAHSVHEAEDNGQPFIPVYIHSTGGCVYSLLSIVDTFRNSSIPIYTCVTGLAASAAACIFSCGYKRFMGPHARLLLHDVSVDFGDTDMTTSNLKVESREVQKLNRALFEIMAENVGADPDFFSKKLKARRNNDVYVSPKRAMQWNLATDLGTPKIIISTSIEMKYEVQESKAPKVENPKGIKRKAPGKKKKNKPPPVKRVRRSNRVGKKKVVDEEDGDERGSSDSDLSESDLSDQNESGSDSD
jgi:ATP-dependent protease ClpP protease subunit